jgi:two-component system, NtrC family, nitrogen regulation response regulator GlnG
MDGTVLVADDDRTIRTVLTQALTRAGCKVHATSSMATLLRWVDEGKGDLIITDVMMPDGNGLEALPQISAARPGLPVIVISAQNTIVTAIQAAGSEAYDYLPKPFDLPDLLKRCARALDVRQHRAATHTAQGGAADIAGNLPLLGKSPAMQALYLLVARVINTAMPVLVVGESGTGKSLVARILHDFSDRRSQPFVVAQASDLKPMDGPSALLAKARGGTLVFDEIADLDDETQGRVVRLMDALPETAPRIIAVSQADPQGLLARGELRKDLYFRLNGVTLSVPALRDRVEDIELLCGHFLARAAQDGTALRKLAPEARDLMRRHAWPGNVRQLENTLRRLAVTSMTPTLSRAEVEAALPGNSDLAPRFVEGEKLAESVARHLRRYFGLHAGMLPPPGLYDRILREIEHPLIEVALAATGGNQAKCAELLGINRNTLRKKITDMDIRVTRGRKLM